MHVFPFRCCAAFTISIDPPTILILLSFVLVLTLSYRCSSHTFVRRTRQRAVNVVSCRYRLSKVQATKAVNSTVIPGSLYMAHLQQRSMVAPGQDATTAAIANCDRKIVPKPSSPTDDQQSTQYSGAFGLSGIEQQSMQYSGASGLQGTGQQSTQYSTVYAESDVVDSGPLPNGYELLIDHIEARNLLPLNNLPASQPINPTQPLFFHRPVVSIENPGMGFSYSKYIQPFLNTKPSKGPAVSRPPSSHPASKLSQVIHAGSPPSQITTKNHSSRSSSVTSTDSNERTIDQTMAKPPTQPPHRLLHRQVTPVPI